MLLFTLLLPILNVATSDLKPSLQTEYQTNLVTKKVCSCCYFVDLSTAVAVVVAVVVSHTAAPSALYVHRLTKALF